MPPNATHANPWSYVHMNAYWQVDTGYGIVTANFTTVEERKDRTLLRGVAADEFGWWHGPLTICLTPETILVRATRSVMADEAPFRVGVTFDRSRRFLRLTVPDDVARRLNEWKREHWTEFPGVADGSSSCTDKGSWEHKALAYLHAVQSQLADQHTFIEGEGFEGMKDMHGNARPGASDILVSTGGVRVNLANPTIGFHFSG